MVEKIDLRPKVLELIQKNGPLVPRDISKEIGHDTFIIGAVLAQLRDSGEILASNTKVGGSPAYYVEGQEENLQALEKYLDPKAKEAYTLLKEHKVLRDYSQPVQVRFSLRQLKDFAQDLTVDVHGTDEIFWKWYLTPIEEAEPLILEMIKLPEPERKVEPKIEPTKEILVESPKEIVKEEPKTADAIIQEVTKEVAKETPKEYSGIKEIVLEEEEPEKEIASELPKKQKPEKKQRIKKETSSQNKKASKHKAKKEKPQKIKEEKKGLFSKVKNLFRF